MLQWKLVLLNMCVEHVTSRKLSNIPSFVVKNSVQVKTKRIEEIKVCEFNLQ